MRKVTRSSYFFSAVVAFGFCMGSFPGGNTEDAAAGSVTRIKGTASKLGFAARSTIAMTGSFPVGADLTVGQATVTVDALLDEVGGAGELVAANFPLVLHVQPGSKPHSARYGTATGIQPRVRVDIPASRTEPGSFILNVQGATLAFPQLCAGTRPTTALDVSFTVDDGVNAPVVVDGTISWSCIGKDATQPMSLKAVAVLAD